MDPKKRQKILLISFIIIILITAGLFYWNYQPKIIIETREEKQIDFSILEDPRLQELKQHGTIDIDIGAVGRDNPFEPL